MNFIFSSVTIKRLIYLILVACLAVMMSQFFLVNEERYWLIGSAFSFALIMTGDTIRRRFATLALGGLIFILMVLITNACAMLNEYLLLIFFVIMTMGSMVLSQCYPRFSVLILVISLFSFVSGLSPIPIEASFNRLEFAALGIVIAIGLQIIFWPYFLRNELQSLIMMTLRELNSLHQTIFACYLQPDYPQAIYLYERRLHIRKTHLMRVMCRLRTVTHLTKAKISIEKKNLLLDLLNQLETLYDLMLDYAQPRRRVSDHTTFGLCASELITISEEITKRLTELAAIVNGRDKAFDTAPLVLSIKRFEENYQNVLQVAAREPLVFMLFITSLKAFCDEMNTCYGLALSTQAMLR